MAKALENLANWNNHTSLTIFLFLIATPKISMIIKILTKRLTHVYFMYFAALFPTHFQVFLLNIVLSPYFSVQLAHNNKGKFFLCKEQNSGHKQQNVPGNSSTHLMPEVSGPKGRQGAWMKLLKQLLHLR